MNRELNKETLRYLCSLTVLGWYHMTLEEMLSRITKKKISWQKV
jgi:hypothetical protein